MEVPFHVIVASLDCDRLHSIPIELTGRITLLRDLELHRDPVACGIIHIFAFVSIDDGELMIVVIEP